MSLRKQATSGFAWTFAQQFGHHIIGFIVSMILARILLPAEFGLIGMISILIGLGRVLVYSGMTQSLIRGEDVDEEDFSTVFFINLAVSVAVYLLAYISAPLVAQFYNQPILVDIIRIYCLTFILTAFSAVQFARLTKNMNFKVQTFIELPANIVGGGVGIYMAYTGFGVYSLVWSQVVTSVVSTVQLWFYSGWSPKWVFNIVKLKDHFNFGYKLALAGVLEIIFKNAYILIIGKFFSPAQVGFYTRAETMKQLPVTNISSALNKVTFPLFSTIQNDNIKLKRVNKQLMQMVIFVIAPILIFVAVLAEPTFRFLFTEKWLPAVPYFQILCITGILKPIHSYNLNILKVKGRSDLLLKLKLYEKGIIILSIIIGLQFGIYGLLFSQVLVSIAIFFVNAHYTDKFIDFSPWEQTKAILPIIFLSVVCGGVIFLLDNYLESQLDMIRILIGGLVGIIVYLGSSILFKMDSYFHIKKLILKKK